MTEREKAVNHFKELYKNGELESYCTQLLNEVSADAEKRKQLALYSLARHDYPIHEPKIRYDLQLAFNKNRIA